MLLITSHQHTHLVFSQNSKYVAHLYAAAIRVLTEGHTCFLHSDFSMPSNFDLWPFGTPDILALGNVRINFGFTKFSFSSWQLAWDRQ